MAVTDIMFRVGIDLDSDQIDVEVQQVMRDLRDALSDSGVEIPIRLDSTGLQGLSEMSQEITALGGQMNVTKDAATGLMQSISVSVPNINGQFVNLRQNVEAVESAAGQTENVFRTTSITSTISGANVELEKARNNVTNIIKLTKERVQIESQLAQAIADGDDTQVSRLNTKLKNNEELTQLYRDQLELLQQQSTTDVDFGSGLQEQINRIEMLSDAQRSLIEHSQDYIDMATNVKQSVTALNEYFTIQQKIQSTTNQANREVLTQQYKDMAPTVAKVVQQMENLGVTFEDNHAQYTGTSTALQKLVETWNKGSDSLTMFNNKMAASADDTEKINEAIEAYKRYRDQLDAVYASQKQGKDYGADYDAQIRQLDQLEQEYQQLEQVILSNNEAIYKSNVYNRDKNQITRNSIQYQKKLNLTMQDNSIANAIAQTIEYTMSLQSLQQVMESVVETTLSLDSAMTQIRLVTEGSREETRELMSTYSQIAKELGSTTEAVAESAVEWLRQGNTIEDTNELIKASTTLSVIGDMEAADAATSLTAALNGYGLAASEAMTIVDQLTTLDLEYATKRLVGYMVTYTIIFPFNCGKALREQYTKLMQKYISGKSNYLGKVKSIVIGQSATKFLLRLSKRKRFNDYSLVFKTQQKQGASAWVKLP